MSDGSYTLNSGLIQAGNKTFYYNSDHSGIVTYVGNTGFNNVKVTSKWGAAGLYSHFINDSPYPTGNRFYK